MNKCIKNFKRNWIRS